MEARDPVTHILTHTPKRHVVALDGEFVKIEDRTNRIDHLA